MLPRTFDVLLAHIGNQVNRTTPDGNLMISPSKQMLLTLWRMATPDSYRSICLRFGVGRATAIRSVRRVSRALCGLAKNVIKWSEGDRGRDAIQGFFAISAFPGIIGAIDGTHINIPAPDTNSEAYVNRKGHHSIQLQATCDHTRLFTHIYVGNVGSVHDARVFRLSEVYDYLSQEDKFPNDSHLVGDAAYAVHEHLLVLYSDNGHLSERQKNFNFCLSSGRMVIERAFGLLKGRWRSLLHNLAMSRVENISFFIMACCVLHNLCLLQGDDIEIMPLDNIEQAPAARAHVFGGQPRALADAKKTQKNCNTACERCVIHVHYEDLPSCST